jgi:SAM-dependent methyltransferase
VFELAGRSVRMLTDPGEISAESFDAVVCLDVLEHVPDPPAFVRMIAGCLREGGRLIVHAPFYMIHPAYPTHLKANRRYSGRVSLYTGAGLRLVDGRAFWNPLVFEKSRNVENSKRRNVAGIRRSKRVVMAMAGAYYALGRWTALPFYPVHVLRWAQSRWFR